MRICTELTDAEMREVDIAIEGRSIDLARAAAYLTVLPDDLGSKEMVQGELEALKMAQEKLWGG